MTLYKWSQTASADATADSTINWAEGQSPSSVNDSARAMMAATAKYRDDIAGAIVTTGTSTAYVVSSYQAFDTLANMANKVIAFTPHATNDATVTLNVDALGAKPLRSAPSAELLAGTLILGTPYVAVYNNSDAVWYLQGFYGNPYNIPLAGGLPFFGATAPNSSFVFPFGQAISRSTYSTLFSLLSTTYGVGDGSTTFNVPDLRGRTIAGKDDMGGVNAGRMTGGGGFTGGNSTILGSAGGSSTVGLTVAQLPAHTHANTLSDPGHAHSVANSAIGSTPTGMQDSARLSQGANSGSPQANHSTTNVSTGITINNASQGSGSVHDNVQPTIVCNYILRII